MPGQEGNRGITQRHTQSPAEQHCSQGHNEVFCSHPLGMASGSTKEQPNLSPFYEIPRLVWNVLNQYLTVAFAVLFKMWQHCKAWCRFPCHGHSSQRNLSVNAEVDMLLYCAKKWKGEALRARQMRKLPEKLLYSQGCNWIQQFSFGPEKYAGTKVYGKLRRCLEVFKKEWTEICPSKDPAKRRKLCKTIFSDEAKERKLYEAIKFLMLYWVIDGYENIKEGHNLPQFFNLLFSRDTSSDPLSFMINHLNPIGDTTGVEQVEMFLVGYTLEVKIKVFRLTKCSTEKCQVFYPEDYKCDWHEICLVTEDDRHYNIPIITK
ncbi:inactive ubiquitin thioesterase OTULINL isoform X2 [Xenopus laevis]|uniref:Inactive ubiquitin thioesterase OTULINL isoform X2 n=1 Tax=Xenopus laevis TaxID=8355 RepID=A0A8J1L211_XENLA|nr:inactive ubiquitin thioesterase OTULINL isoform X2 [Xenopus laevis]